jgi:hypothetical protein
MLLHAPLSLTALNIKKLRKGIPDYPYEGNES